MIGILLFIITFVVNLTADLIVRGVAGVDDALASATGRRVQPRRRTRPQAAPRKLSRKCVFGVDGRCRMVVPLVADRRLSGRSRRGRSLSLGLPGRPNPPAACAAAASGRRSLGTIWLVGVSLADRGADRRAGRGLPERVRARQLAHAHHQPRGRQPRRRAAASCTRCSALGRVRAVRCGFGARILAASLTLAIMTLPVIIASTKEALASVPLAFREACWNVGATRWQTIRARRAAQLDQRHSHRRHPPGVARRRRDRADHVHRRRLLQTIAPVILFAYSVYDQCMALSMHLFTVSTQVPERARRRCPTRIALVLLGVGAAGQRAVDRAPRLPALAQEVVTPCASAPTARRSRSQDLRRPLRRARRSLHGDLASTSTTQRDLRRSSARRSPGKTSLLRCHQPHARVHRRAPRSPARSGSTARTSSDRATSTRCAAGSAWSPRCRSACRCRSTTTSPSRRASAGMRDKADLDDARRALPAPGRALGRGQGPPRRASARKLSGGQQQRLTIARALSHEPEILCLDEFSIAIDPVTTMRIEDVLKELRSEMTIILVTNLVQQARRLADRTVFLLERRARRGRTAPRSCSPASPRTGAPTTTCNGIFG